AALGSDEQLATSADDRLLDRHHGALVLRVEEAQRVDHVSRPFGPDGSVLGGAEHVEDSAPKRKLSALLDQRLAGVTELDEPSCDGNGVRSLTWLQDHRAPDEIVARDRLPRGAAARGHDDDWFVVRVGEGCQCFEPAVDRFIEGGWTVEKRN